MIKTYKGGKILVSVTCDMCIHRPKYDVNGAIVPPMRMGLVYEYPDYTCPYLCIGNDYYNYMPKDHDFCSKGEKKED